MIRVVELDIGDDGAAGMVKRERPIRLVRLGHPPARPPGARARAIADQHRQVVSGHNQDVAQHVSRRRLSRGAGDRDRVGLVDQLRQHLGAAQHRQAHRARRVQLRRTLDRSAVNEEVLGQDVLGVVPDHEAHAGVLELLGRLGRFGVTAADLVPAGKKDTSEGRHPSTPRAHQVHSQCFATSRRTASTCAAASRRPAEAEAFAIARRRSSSRPAMVATRLGPLRSASPSRTAAPASTIAAAFCSWWPPPNVPGMRIIGSPTAVASAMVPTPALLTSGAPRARNPAMSSVNPPPVYPTCACCPPPAAPWRPATWTTSSKRLQSSSTTDHTAWFRLRAPWLPPLTSSRRAGPSGTRRAKPSRSGTPVSSVRWPASRFSVPGSVVQITAAPPAKIRVASPGLTSFSCSTYGIPRMRAAATAGAIT